MMPDRMVHNPQRPVREAFEEVASMQQKRGGQWHDGPS